MKFAQNAITLVEMIICTLVLAIIAVIAMPYVNDYKAQQEVIKISQTIKSNIQQARHAATIYRNNIVVCGSSTATQCDGQWNEHILLFIDNNRNRQRDTTEQILEQNKLNLKHGQLKWRGSLGINAIALRPSAAAALGSMGSFYYCAQNNQHHRKIILNKMALLRTETPNDCT